jgi:hypothetical protein
MIQINVDSKGIDRLIFKLEKRVESYTEAVDDTMDEARRIVIDRLRKGKMTNGKLRRSPAKVKRGKYSFDYGKYDREKKAQLTTSIVTLEYSGAMFKNFLINKGSRVNLRNRLFKRSLYFSNNYGFKANGKRSKYTFRQIAEFHDATFGSPNYNLNEVEARAVLRYFKRKLKEKK